MRTLKKLAAALLITILTASSAFAVVYGQAGYETHGDSESDAWEINNVDTLIKVRDDLEAGRINTAKYYRLTNDIDLSSYRDWIPIGPDEDEWNYNKAPFSGVFDGGGHTIKVNIARTNQTYTGLFGVVSGGTIKNLKVEGRVAVSNSTTSYAWSGGYNSYVGGIVAYLLGGRIENCTFDGTITGTSTSGWPIYVGGIVGANRWDEAVITNCKVGGKDSSTKIKASNTLFSSDSYASGIIGYFMDYNSGNVITSNYSRATLSAGHMQNLIYGYRDGTSGRVFGNTEKNPSEQDNPDDPIVEAVSIATSFLPDGVLGDSYYASLEASGTAPITWALTSGNLPAGLTLNSAGSISGTPTQEGTFSFTLQASNSSTSDSRAFSIWVRDDRVAPTITTSSYLGSYSVGDLVSIQLYAIGTEPITWSAQDGTMPAGLSLNSSGLLSGTLTTAGTFSFTIRATNAKGSYDSWFTMDVVSPRIEIDNDSPLYDATVGTYYSNWFYATGYDLPSYEGWVWSATDLPDGFNMDSDGYFYGMPTQEGKFSFKVKVQNGNYSAEKTFELNIEAETFAPSITTSWYLGSYPIGTSVNIQLYANGTGPITWSKYSGTLPAGLTLDSNGLLSGTLTVAGQFTFGVDATNTKGSDYALFTMDVLNPRIEIDDTYLYNARVGEYYGNWFYATGYDLPSYESWVWSATNLPGGFNMDSYGYFYGTPTEAGTFSFTVTAKNGDYSAEKTFTITVDPAETYAPSIITSSYLGSYAKGDILSVQFYAYGTEPITWSTGGNLPAGLSLSAVGVLYGTLSDAGSFSFTITATNEKGSDSRVFTLDVASPRVEIDNASPLDNATVGEYYSEWFSATGYDLPSYESWEWSATNLPSGFSMSSYGYFYGRPTEAGTFSFTVTAKNGNYSVEKTFELTVDPAEEEENPPSITTYSLPQATVGISYSYQLEAESDTDVEWSVDGLPSGLYYTSDGLIYGAPEVAGTWLITVYAENDAGTDSRGLTLSVIEAETGIPIDSEHFPDDNFREYISNYLDANVDGLLSPSEIASITEIYARGFGIESVEGIEYFTELTDLTLWDNELTEIDLSANTKLTYLDLDNNHIEDLKLDGLTGLQSLYCANNELWDLYLSENTALETLSCAGNHLLTLDLSNNTSLHYVSISDQNVEELYVSKNANDGRYTVNLFDLLEENVERVNPDTVRSEFGTAAEFDEDSAEIIKFFT